MQASCILMRTCGIYSVVRLVSYTLMNSCDGEAMMYLRISTGIILKANSIEHCELINPFSCDLLSLFPASVREISFRDRRNYPVGTAYRY